MKFTSDQLEVKAAAEALANTLHAAAADAPPAPGIDSAWGGRTLHEQFPWTRPHKIAAAGSLTRPQQAAPARAVSPPPEAPARAPISAPALEAASASHGGAVLPTAQGEPGPVPTLFDPANESWNDPAELQLSVPKVGASARATDPATSHQAAAGARSTRHALYPHVLAALAAGPLTDWELAQQLTEVTGRRVIATSAGKRRGELRDLGLVVATDERGMTEMTTAGGIRWALTAAGRAEAARIAAEVAA